MNEEEYQPDPLRAIEENRERIDTRQARVEKTRERERKARLRPYVVMNKIARELRACSHQETYAHEPSADELNGTALDGGVIEHRCKLDKTLVRLEVQV